MSYTEQDRYHIGRVRGRIEGEDAVAAFDRLMIWAEETRGIFVYPLARGEFSAIYLATRPVARKHADCPFGFTGARHHVRWAFRKPCFDAGLCSLAEVEATFDGETSPETGEVMTNLHAVGDVEKLIGFLAARLTRARGA